jgi:ABC-type dipeptide/oligopeptide/nickel transport system ATPase component
MSNNTKWSCDILADMIKARVNLDKNYMGVAVGETGSGKSAATSRILGAVDESFYDECRVVFTPTEFMETIKDMDKYEAIMFDEAGVGISHREWMHTQNKLIGMVTQLFRHLNLVVVFTVPNLSFIDVMERKLLHGIIEMRKIDHVNKYSISKYWINHTDALTGDTTLKPAFYGGNNILDAVLCPMPETTYWNKYLKKKEAFADNFYKNTLQEMKEGSSGKPDKKTMDAYRRKEETLCKIIEHYKIDHTWKDISDITGISDRTLRDWCASIVPAGGK